MAEHTKKKEPLRLWTESPLPTLWIRYKGVFDMQEVYEAIADWFKGRKFNFYEKLADRRRTTPFGVEERYHWVGRRKENDYVEYVIELKCEIFDSHPIEMVMKDGKVKNLIKGRLWMQFDNMTVFDWEHKWESTPFFAELRNFYHKYFLRNWNEYVWTNKVYNEMVLIHDLVEKKLQMGVL